MNAAAVVLMAIVLATAIPSGATGEELIPYIDIQHPEDGSTVGTEEVLVVVAEGRDLQSPAFSVEGEQMGYAGPLTGCIFEVNEDSTETHMYCRQDISLKSFEGQNVKVKVSVKENNGMLTDGVGLYVSGDCA